ncbi:uncharacterized protein [Amphiura filiformis]|uniref:uncharacterized protein isoform X2 n=1 Tax=Amphiura filiformis TaxID=82378 RepID=UPI003B21C505
MPGPTPEVGNTGDGGPATLALLPTDDEPSCKEGILDLSSCHLTVLALPQKDYSSTTVLNLDYNDITELPNDVITSLPQLRQLSLIGNDLKEFPSVLGQLSKLQVLAASENEISHLPDSFKCLKELETLDLVGNKLTELIPDFGCLMKLQRLDVEENSLHFLPESFGCLESLEVFEANGNEIRNLPENFGELKKLRVLNLSNNKLDSLPESFGKLPSLKWVDLSGNHIESLPDPFESAVTLERLYLISNDIHRVPGWIGNMPNLTELSFRDNQLGDSPFSEAFGSVSIQLESFDISGNFIKSLPSTIGNMKGLQTLHMGSVIGELERRNFQNGNWIPQLPDSFGELVNLKELRADENQLSELPEKFGQLVHLEFIDLGQNMLLSLPNSFSQLKSLKVCKLSKNHLKCLPEDFGLLKNLEDLRLDSNQIKSLPKSMENLTELTTFDLFDNHLTSIPACLDNFKKITRLDLDENDIDLPYYNTPYLTQDNKYPERDPQKANNWRGKARVDNVMRYDLPKFLNNSKTAVSNNLLQAMQNSRSIWESHEGSTEPRQRPTARAKNDESRTNSENTHQVNGDNVHEVTGALESIALGDGHDRDGDTCYRVSRNKGQVQFHYTSSEGTESEGASDVSIDGRPYASSDGRSCSPVPIDPSNDVSPEDWDAELEESPPYDMTVVYQHPRDVKRLFFDFRPNFEFIPSHEHVQNIPTAKPDELEVETGQFDDA